jgi:preprotein translocase subunit SecA
MVLDIIEEVGEGIIAEYTDEKRYPEEWDLDGLREAFHQYFSFPLGLEKEAVEGMKQEDLRASLMEKVRTFYEEKEKAFGADIMRDLERFILLRDLDSHWKDHLLNIDHLKEGIGLRAYAQKNPLLEYKREGYELFISMLASVRENAVRKLFAVQLACGSGKKYKKCCGS